MAILGTSGSGKSFTLQLLALRLRRKNIQVFILAPLKGHEFYRAARNIGGEIIQISPSSPHCINVMEIRPVDTAAAELLDEAVIEKSLLTAKIQRLHIFFALLIPDMTHEERQLTSGEKSIIIEGPPAGYSPLQATSSIKYFGNRGRWLTYYTNEGVAYSDKYALSYNPNFYTFEGADCANFASQCIDAGTRQTARDDKFKPYTSAWTSSTNSLKNWNDGYTWKLNPEDTWMSAGQLIYYDWNGTGGYQSFSHTTYCVGTDSSGVPIVNSHTTDKYHVRWNYGGSNCKYATFAIAG